MPYKDKEKQTISSRKQYEKKRAYCQKFGLCLRCRKIPVTPARKGAKNGYCEECKQIMRDRLPKDKALRKINFEKRMAKYAAEGKCICGKIIDTNFKRCSFCRAIAAETKRKTKDAAFNAYGGYICNCCGETIHEFLSIDHINNDGYKHKTEKGYKVNGMALYCWLRNNNYPPNFQVLCMNCNWGKRHNGVCPHHYPKLDEAYSI